MRASRSILLTRLLRPRHRRACPGADGAAPGLTEYPKCSAAPNREDSEAAHGAYKFGKRKFDEGDYATSVNYFKDAFRSDCTKNDLLIIIARAYELSGNRAEAANALETYLQREPNAQDAEVQRRRIANMQGRR